MKLEGDINMYNWLCKKVRESDAWAWGLTITAIILMTIIAIL